MALNPNIKNKSAFMLKTCSKCGQSFGSEGFAPTKSLFYADKVLPICNDCIDKIINDKKGDWAIVDKVCQMADVPFIPARWQEVYSVNPVGAFYRYASIFLDSQYNDLGWGDYYQEFLKLKEAKMIETELPGLKEERLEKLKQKWGANYDEEALEYLENLFNGLLATQNINGSLQIDQAKKLCKMSYEIDLRINEGTEFDKLLKSYDTLVKAADLTPKNVKNVNDFDSFGEAVKWLEKNGWKNKFYDKVTRDIVDESMKNFENFNQRLYINESNIGEEIQRRIEALKSTQETESYYDTNKEYDLDEYDQDGYERLINIDDEFESDLEEGEKDDQ